MPNSKKSISGTKDGRVRNFACVVYPDSAPSNWLDIISEAKIAVFVSPLHDKDKNPTGEDKKPHYHVLVAYERQKSIEQASDFFKSFGGVGCEVVQSLRGYARYLCHLDNPEKAQYSIDEVKTFGGADFIGAIGLPIDKYKAIGEMVDFIEFNDIFSYAQIFQYARACRNDWFRVLCDTSTLVIKEYLKSRKWDYDHRMERPVYRKFDVETGEVE